MIKDERFKKSNEAGKICEERFARYIEENLGGKILETAPDKRFKDRDIKALIDGIEVTFEVKSDRKSEHTPNCYIEYQYKVRDKDKKTRVREDSGIAGTKADYFITYSDRKRRQQSVEELRKRLKTHRKRSVIGGDDDRTKGWIFPHADMPDLCDWIEDLEELPPYVEEETEAQECVGG